MSEPVQAEAPPAAPRSRRKVLAIGIAFLVILVAVAATAVYYLTLPTPFGGTIKVGFSISLTGQFNVEGKNSLNGIKTVLNWINGHGGVTVQGKVYNFSLDYYDDQSTPGNIGTLYPRIIQNDNATFLLAPYSSGLTAAKNAGADDLIGGGHYTDGLLIMNQLKTTWNAPPPKFVSLLVAVTEPAFQSQLAGSANNVTGPSQWETAVSYSPTFAQSAGLSWYGPTPAEFTQLYGSLNNGDVPAYHAAEAGASLLVLANAIQRANSFNTTAVRAQLGSMHIMDFFGEFQIDSRGLQVSHSMVLVQWQAGVKKVVLPADIADGSCQYPYSGA